MRHFFILLFLFSGISVQAQRGELPLNQARADSIVEKHQQDFPKFYKALRAIETQDTLIKQFIFIEKDGVGPAFAAPRGVITINLAYLQNPKPNFDDNRLIVVLYHEVGHLHYYQTTSHQLWTPENSEKAAFEYSLFKTKKIAAAGDCGPLAAGVKFMKLRSGSNDLRDAHVRALKRMVNEPLYAEYVQYVGEHCR